MPGCHNLPHLGLAASTTHMSAGEKQDESNAIGS
jgi:hypothetical protein